MIYMPEEVKTAISKLADNGFEAYIVGGCVRDSLLGSKPKDYDITTSAEPNEVEKIFSNYRVIETGIKHGTVTVLINNMPLEITTFRIDSDYSDNRHPENVTFTKSLEEDTARRDFTINALAYNDECGICDFYGGTDDIRNKIIRCVGDADKRFNEDALRIMRAVRFSSVLGFQIEENTKYAIFKNKELLKNISSERIASELVKLLCGENVKKVLLEYADILGVVIPELLPMKGFEQRNIHHIYDIFEHTAVAVENIEPTPILRLTALFHDIGKPKCFFMKNGEGHFYGHADIGAEMTIKILSRLKFDNNTKNTVTKLVKIHDVQIEETDTAIKRCMNKHTAEIFFMLLKMKQADTLAQSPMCYDRLEYLGRLEKKAHEIIEKNACFSLKDLAVNGSDLIALGLKPGKELGLILKKILDKVIAGKLPNEKEALIKFTKENYLNNG